MEHQSDGGLSLPRPFSFWQTCQVRRFLVLGTLPRGTAIRFTCYATLRDCQLSPGEISADHRRSGQNSLMILASRLLNLSPISNISARSGTDDNAHSATSGRTNR